MKDKLREVCPGFSREGAIIVDEALSGDTGRVTVRTTDERHVGEVHFGGILDATVRVEVTGVSRASGGELYEPVAIETHHADHIIVDSLPSGPYAIPE